MKSGDPSDNPTTLRKIDSNPVAYFAKRGLVLVFLTVGLIAITMTYLAGMKTPGTTKFTGDNEILLFAIIFIFTVYYYRQTWKAYKTFKQMKHRT